MLVLYYLLILRENECIGSIYSLTWTRYLFVKNSKPQWLMRIFVQAIHVFAYMFTVNVESSANHFLLYVRCFARFVAITIQNLCNASILTKTTLWEWISCMVGSKHCPSKYWRNAEERFTKPISHVQICNTITEGKNI